MKIAIIGSGFTGLAAAWDLQKAGHQVFLFEKEVQAGGLAAGFKEKGWHWFLDFHYHHIFQTDKEILTWLDELGLEKEVFFSDTQTSTLYDGKLWRLDSPVSLLQFSPLSLLGRLRTALVLAFLKLLPNGQWLERWTAEEFLQATMGRPAYQLLWEPLFIGKFGREKDKINMAWFWARIKARSQRLGYMKGGFQQLINKIETKLKEQKVKFVFQAKIKKITTKGQKIILNFEKNKIRQFDLVVFTTPSAVVKKLLTRPPKQLKNLPGLGAMTLVLELDKPFFKNGNYWLNINEKHFPFLAVVEHSNLTGNNKYAKKSLLYVAKYLPAKSVAFAKNKQAVLSQYKPFLAKLSPDFSKNTKRSWLFKSEFAQPLVYKNHSLRLPPFKLDERIYWASMQHIYPWDRGTNFAVKAGRKIAKQIINDGKKNIF